MKIISNLIQFVTMNYRNTFFQLAFQLIFLIKFQPLSDSFHLQYHKNTTYIFNHFSLSFYKLKSILLTLLYFQLLRKMQLLKRCYPLCKYFYGTLSKFKRNNIQYNFCNYKKLKQQSKVFYNKEVENVFELQNNQDWKIYIENSEVPIVLDCYADWCQPCKKLTPILQEKAKSAKGWKLIKLNIDKLPQLANMLQIKAVPTVYLISEGKGIDGFSGFPEQKILKRFFTNLQKILAASHQTGNIINKLQEARILLSEGKHKQAASIFEESLKNKIQASLLNIIYLHLAQCYLRLQKYSLFEQTIKKIDKIILEANQTLDENLKMLHEYFSVLNNQYAKIKNESNSNSVIVTLTNQLQNDPENLQKKFKLANQYFQLNHYQESIKLLIEIVKKEKNWANSKANKLILEMFKKVGPTTDFSIKYRKIYQRLLY